MESGRIVCNSNRTVIKQSHIEVNTLIQQPIKERQNYLS